MSGKYIPAEIETLCYSIFVGIISYCFLFGVKKCKLARRFDKKKKITYSYTEEIQTGVIAGMILLSLVRGFLNGFLPYLEPRDDDAVLFGTYNFVIGLSIDVMMGIFTIMSATMLAKIIVEEYEKKAIVFFSYPIERKDFLAVKIITCLLCICFLMFISGTIVLVVFIGTEKIFPLL